MADNRLVKVVHKAENDHRKNGVKTYIWNEEKPKKKQVTDEL